jgi:hypothetical protein
MPGLLRRNDHLIAFDRKGSPYGNVIMVMMMFMLMMMTLMLSTTFWT